LLYLSGPKKLAASSEKTRNKQMTDTIDNEQEAAVALLFASVMNESTNLGQSRIEHLSRILVLCSKFRGHDLNEMSAKALSLCSSEGSKNVIEKAAPLISADFRETLFTMTCELVTDDGNINEKESELLGMVALYLGISIETMRMMLTTYLIRNRWNVKIVD
jgi:uncharacterized tellurite resistance protein B-like protein